MIRVDLEKIMFYPPSKGYAILLREPEGNRQLPIIVGVFEAQSIALALEKVAMPRPLTHDLCSNILKELNIRIPEILVSELIDGTFHAKIFLEKMGEREMIQIDSRPSDAIALALRMNASIYVADKVMDEAGQIISQKAGKEEIYDDESPEIKTLDLLFELRNELQQAIEEENYEQAAKLRDKIQKIEKELNIN